MSTVVIVGTGLLGSSFGLAVQRAGLFERVVGVSSPAVVEKAIAVGAVDQALPLEEALPLADLVLLSQPVRRILTLLESMDSHLRPGTLVTDVGSTKAEICAAGAKFIQRGKFVGGHPMAGREVRGPEGASADLFEGRPWVLTEPHEQLVAMVKALGGRPVFLNPEEHDKMVSLSSHLPQILSTGLASYLAGKDVKQVVGPGLLDMTRLAQSSYELWEDILLTNAGNVDEALAGLIEELSSMRQALGSSSLAAHFTQGDVNAKSLRTP
jgi:prephenate dehydrogenase